MGNIPGAVVHAANLHDTSGGLFPLQEALIHYPTFMRISADAGYKGTFVQEMKECYCLPVEIPEKEPAWQILPKLKVVERIFSWLGSSHRQSKDNEITTSSVETFINISHIHTLLKRL